MPVTTSDDFELDLNHIILVVPPETVESSFSPHERILWEAHVNIAGAGWCHRSDADLEVIGNLHARLGHMSDEDPHHDLFSFSACDIERGLDAEQRELRQKNLAAVEAGRAPDVERAVTEILNNRERCVWLAGERNIYEHARIELLKMRLGVIQVPPFGEIIKAGECEPEEDFRRYRDRYSRYIDEMAGFQSTAAVPCPSTDRTSPGRGNDDFDVAAVLAGKKPVAWFGVNDQVELAVLAKMAEERGMEIRRAPDVENESYLIGRADDLNCSLQIMDLYPGRGEIPTRLYNWAFGKSLGYNDEAVQSF